MMLMTVIDKLKNLQIADEEVVEPSASSIEIFEFSQRFKDFFGHDLPNEYSDFLRQMNGYEHNGLIIYGTRDSVSDLSSSSLDLIEANIVARDSERSELKDIALLGEDCLGVLSYDFIERKYQYRDRIGLDRVDPFESFAHLLADQLPKIES